MEEGTVIKTTGSSCIVQDMSGKEVICMIKGKFRIEGFKTTNPVAVGDRVYFHKSKNDEYGIIHEITERKNYIIRKSSNLSKLYHIVAANIDQAMLVITIKYPKTALEFIDRFLITSEAYNIKTILVFNKTDLYKVKEQMEVKELRSIYEKIGYKCVETSAVKYKNIDLIKALLKHKTTLIAGYSGVGKSTLLNAIDKTLERTTKEISSYHKTGKHATTYAEMVSLKSGGQVIDTPGIRGFGIIDFEKNEIYHYFPEIFRYSKNCKYHNCIHINEPECAVKKAVSEGNISELRYCNYLRILHDEHQKYR